MGGEALAGRTNIGDSGSAGGGTGAQAAGSGATGTGSEALEVLAGGSEVAPSTDQRLGRVWSIVVRGALAAGALGGTGTGFNATGGCRLVSAKYALHSSSRKRRALG
jgi:hypothetical protein